MKRVRFILILIVLISLCVWACFKTYEKSEKKCTYPLGPECRSSEYCIFLDHDRTSCMPKGSEDTPIVLFPLELDHPTICTQGPMTKKGRTHSYLNTAFAVDFSSPPNIANGKIIAAINGTIITVNNNCNNKDSEKFNNDRCGNGFGNWLVIADDENKIFTFYAHLRKVFKKKGDFVVQGMVIGEEGKTGSAGHRHLHFSVHRNIWKMSQEEITKYNPGLPPSINFIFKGAHYFDASKLPCIDSNDLTRPPFLGRDL